ncbi:hypothetical protein NDU88_002253 [Pleurodeles waltl]|uniref:Uncharacterized protein n=1 Tax=Pleurodeles waltl TaxID=8319 RepID=A0AAV7T280_PLEWA|nr:hypothetical protein NDU88_002253 [Pleurodeles waltl]
MVIRCIPVWAQPTVTVSRCFGPIKIRIPLYLVAFQGAQLCCTIAAPAATVLQRPQRSGVSQRERTAEDGAPSVPQIGRKPDAPSSSLGSPPAVATVTLVPLLGEDDSHLRSGSKRLLSGSLL